MNLLIMPAAVILLLVLATAQAQTQTIFKCKDAKGQTSFQHQPCDGSGNGAIAVRPANVVDGRPGGEQQVRSDAARRSEVRAAQERGELSPAMTSDEMLHVLRGPAPPVGMGSPAAPTGRYQRPLPQGLKPCYSELEIRNATMDASSATRSRDDRRAAQIRERQMRNCIR